ncbi:MAG: hypothetical protein M1818_006646 [Claussenomyces sp. TS43310]|nr:MAG: hypothetical protein M1818_006921 [Claussenomyces sp. TS43310]KAI9735069.1 MAG: hypothetical protein M1818_006646 [Claussenomyces sp. TS43310]
MHHPPPSPPILFLDWDGTMTKSDTLSLLANITGYRHHHPHSSNSSSSSSATPPPPLPPWLHFTSAYVHDLAAHRTRYAPAAAARTTIAAELAWLESLAPVERASVERVEAARVFAGVTPRVVQAAVIEAVTGREEAVVWRTGLSLLVARVLGAGGVVRVVSVNWSARFIRACLEAGGSEGTNAAAARGGGGDQGPGRDSVDWSRVRVHANEVGEGGDGRLSRYFGDRGIWTAGDKRRVLDEVLDEVGSRASTIYVGDSPTDLHCLLDVDIGICVRDEPMGSEQRALAETLDRLSIETRWIGTYQGEGKVDDGDADRVKKSLWWARDFEEIVQSTLFKGS